MSKLDIRSSAKLKPVTCCDIQGRKILNMNESINLTGSIQDRLNPVIIDSVAGGVEGGG